MSNRNRRGVSPSRQDRGSLAPTTAKAADASLEARFGRLVTPLPSGCWAFSGHLDRYGTFSFTQLDGKSLRIKAHRFAYETLVGPIPVGHHLHHECENPGCVNPKHLRPLTPAEHNAEHARLSEAS